MPVPMNADARRARATIAATRRHHPEADTSALEAEFLAALEASRTDEHINALVAAAPALSAEQRARLRPVFDRSLWGPSGAGAVG